jgi:hypothetical protein
VREIARAHIGEVSEDPLNLLKETPMKRQVITIALGSLFALPALANNEIDAGYNPPAQVSTPSAEQVFVNAEQGYEFKATWVAGKSRSDVRAEVAQALRSGDYIVNAELGTTANQL